MAPRHGYGGRLSAGEDRVAGTGMCGSLGQTAGGGAKASRRRSTGVREGARESRRTGGPAKAGVDRWVGRGMPGRADHGRRDRGGTLPGEEEVRTREEEGQLPMCWGHDIG